MEIMRDPEDKTMLFAYFYGSHVPMNCAWRTRLAQVMICAGGTLDQHALPAMRIVACPRIPLCFYLVFQLKCLFRKLKHVSLQIGQRLSSILRSMHCIWTLMQKLWFERTNGHHVVRKPALYSRSSHNA